MKVVSLKSEVRSETGKGGARRARRQGKVPAIVYGEGKPPETITLPQHEFRMAVDAGARVIDLDIAARGVERVLLSELQFDPLGMNLVHADFKRMDPAHEITLSIPIDFEGAPKGLAQGGVLTILRDTLKVRCLPRDIPEHFLVDVSGMELNTTISAGAIPLPTGVTLAEEAHDTICTCAIPRVKVEEPTPAEAAAAAAAAEGAPAEGAPGAEGAAAAAPGAAGAAPAAGGKPGAAGGKGAAAAAPAEGAKGDKKKK
jgi:large subunit ribosomal protein L25